MNTYVNPIKILFYKKFLRGVQGGAGSPGLLWPYRAIPRLTELFAAVLRLKTFFILFLELSSFIIHKSSFGLIPPGRRRQKKPLHLILILLFSTGLWAETRTYDLAAFLGRVESYSRDLKLAQKELDLAKVRKREAVSTALPTVTVDADYKRNLKDNFLYIDFPDFETGAMTNQKFKINYKNEYGLQAMVSQTLFSFKVGSALTAAKQYKTLTDFIYHATYQTIMKLSKKAFYQALLLEKVRDVGRESEKNAQENWLDMKKKYDHGQVSQFHLLQAEARWRNMVPETARARRNYELLLNNLKNLAGIPAAEDIRLKGDLSDIPALPGMKAMDVILEQRPDFKALLWEEKLRRTGIKAERANQLPGLHLNLIYNFSSLSDRFKLERRNNSYIIGLNLSIPIYSGGYQQAQVQKAKIELEKTRIKIDQEREAIYNEIHNIYLRLEEARQRLEAAKTSLVTAKKAFDIAEITAASGLATQLELKDARVVYDQARLNVYASAYDYLDAYFDWQQAAGDRK